MTTDQVEVGRWLNGPLERLCLELLAAGTRQEFSVPAACALIAWQAHFDRPSPRLQAAIAACLTDTRFARVARKDIAITLASRPGFGTGTLPHQRARWALVEFDAELRAHERFQLLIASCVSAEDIDERLPLIESAVAEYRAWMQQAGAAPLHVLYELTGMFQLLGVALTPLIEEGRITLLGRLLALWFTGTPVPAAPLFAFVQLSSGARYAREGRTVAVASPDLDALTRAMNEAFGLTMRSPNPAFALTAPERFLIPDRTKASAFEDEASRYLQSDGVRELAPAPNHHAVLVPSMAVAPQALWLRDAGRTWPISASFRLSEPDRSVRHVLVWASADVGPSLEAEVVTRIFTRAGIHCETVIVSADDPEAAAAFVVPPLYPQDGDLRRLLATFYVHSIREFARKRA